MTNTLLNIDNFQFGRVILQGKEVEKIFSSNKKRELNKYQRSDHPWANHIRHLPELNEITKYLYFHKN